MWGFVSVEKLEGGTRVLVTFTDRVTGETWVKNWPADPEKIRAARRRFFAYLKRIHGLQ